MTGTLSEIKHEILRVEWTIDDFLSLQPESIGSFHESPNFRHSDDDSWSFSVCPYGDEETKDGIGLYLRHGDPFLSPTTIFTLAVKKTDGSLHSEKPLTWKFRGQDFYGNPQMMLRSDLLRKKDEFLFEGALTFCCVLRKVPPAEVMDDLSLDLKKLHESLVQSDVTVKLTSRELRAHRAVLAARSDVFAAALEKENGSIKEKDCDANSFGEFLKHLYTDRADINEGNVFDLYRTAHKYQVGELKSICVAFLMENLSVDNVCDVIALAADNHQEDLENFCKLFFYDNAGSILVTSDWLSLMERHRVTSAKLLKLIAPKLTVKE